MSSIHKFLTGQSQQRKCLCFMSYSEALGKLPLYAPRRDWNALVIALRTISVPCLTISVEAYSFSRAYRNRQISEWSTLPKGNIHPLESTQTLQINNSILQTKESHSHGSGTSRADGMRSGTGLSVDNAKGSEYHFARCTHLIEIDYLISNYKLNIYVLPLSLWSGILITLQGWLHLRSLHGSE